MSMDTPNEATTRELSRALDEIYELRVALAEQARIAEVNLSYKTFPKTRRAIMEDQIERMRKAARGDVFNAFGDRADQVRLFCLKEAGAEQSMTRSQWREQRGIDK